MLPPDLPWCRTPHGSTKPPAVNTAGHLDPELDGPATSCLGGVSGALGQGLPLGVPSPKVDSNQCWRGHSTILVPGLVGD